MTTAHHAAVSEPASLGLAALLLVVVVLGLGYLTR